MHYNLDKFVMNEMRIVTVAPIKVQNSIAEYQDARSAGFYAMGRALRTGKPVVLLVPGEFLTSVHTALTECWFQKAPVIVIAFFAKVSEAKTQWMDRCVINTLTAGIDEEMLIRQFLEENASPNGPILLNVVGESIQPEAKNYAAAMKQVTDRPVRTFHGTDPNTIPYQYKYGVISKYIGSSIIKDCGILMCTADCVMVDVNVFRTRYANSNMKIAVFDDGTMRKNNVALWIQSNSWECRESDTIEDIAWLCSVQKQAVLIIREG